jgi:hypothetical protein
MIERMPPTAPTTIPSGLWPRRSAISNPPTPVTNWRSWWATWALTYGVTDAADLAAQLACQARKLTNDEEFI